jgi:hypothetical protein
MGDPTPPVTFVAIFLSRASEMATAAVPGIIPGQTSAAGPARRTCQALAAAEDDDLRKGGRRRPDKAGVAHEPDHQAIGIIGWIAAAGGRN